MINQESYRDHLRNEVMGRMKYKINSEEDHDSLQSSNEACMKTYNRLTSPQQAPRKELPRSMVHCHSPQSNGGDADRTLMYPPLKYPVLQPYKHHDGNRIDDAKPCNYLQPQMQAHEREDVEVQLHNREHLQSSKREEQYNDGYVQEQMDAHQMQDQLRMRYIQHQQQVRQVQARISRRQSQDIAMGYQVQGHQEQIEEWLPYESVQEYLPQRQMPETPAQKRIQGRQVQQEERQPQESMQEYLPQRQMPETPAQKRIQGRQVQQEERQPQESMQEYLPQNQKREMPEKKRMQRRLTHEEELDRLDHERIQERPLQESMQEYQLQHKISEIAPQRRLQGRQAKEDMQECFEHEEIQEGGLQESMQKYFPQRQMPEMAKNKRMQLRQSQHQMQDHFDEAQMQERLSPESMEEYMPHKEIQQHLSLKPQQDGFAEEQGQYRLAEQMQYKVAYERKQDRLVQQQMRDRRLQEQVHERERQHQMQERQIQERPISAAVMTAKGPEATASQQTIDIYEGNSLCGTHRDSKDSFLDSREQTSSRTNISKPISRNLRKIVRSQCKLHKVIDNALKNLHDKDTRELKDKREDHLHSQQSLMTHSDFTEDEEQPLPASTSKHASGVAPPPHPAAFYCRCPQAEPTILQMPKVEPPQSADIPKLREVMHEFSKNDFLDCRTGEPLDLSFDDVVQSKVITPIVTKLQQMYLNCLQNKVSAMLELQTLPQRVQEVYKASKALRSGRICKEPQQEPNSN